MSENKERAHEVNCSIQINSRHGCDCMVSEIERLEKANARNNELLIEALWLLSHTGKDTVFFHETGTYRKRRLALVKELMGEK